MLSQHNLFAVGRQFWRVGQYRRQALVTPDGGLIALDWFLGCDTASHIDQSAPVLLVFHGLTGEVHEPKVSSILQWVLIMSMLPPLMLCM